MRRRSQGRVLSLPQPNQSALSGSEEGGRGREGRRIRNGGREKKKAGELLKKDAAGDGGPGHAQITSNSIIKNCETSLQNSECSFDAVANTDCQKVQTLNVLDYRALSLISAVLGQHRTP